MPGLNRHLAITGCVVLLHVAALWALQVGLLRRVVEVFVPVQIISELVEPPRPVTDPPTVLAPPTEVARKVANSTATPAPTPLPKPQPTPRPQAKLDIEPAPNPPAAVTMAPAPPPHISAPPDVAAAPAAPLPAPAAPARLELPSSDADYLKNPKPPYPPISKRLGEQGTVLVQVLIGVDGHAQNAEIKKSSGFDRLDQAALATVLKWRYVPGKRAGVPQAMWVPVPITFVLE